MISCESGALQTCVRVKLGDDIIDAVPFRELIAVRRTLALKCLAPNLLSFAQLFPLPSIPLTTSYPAARRSANHPSWHILLISGSPIRRTLLSATSSR